MKRNNKGFTMAELLIVVAIIAILVGIAIPTFSDQMERSREGVDLSAVRNSYSEAMSAYLTSKTTKYPAIMTFKQTVPGWTIDTSELPFSGLQSVTKTSNDKAVELLFTKSGDAVSVKVAESTDFKAAKYDGDKGLALTGLKAENAMTALAVDLTKFEAATAGDMTGPFAVLKVDFGTIKGLKYENGQISGTPEEEIKDADKTAVTFYILDKDGVLGKYTVADVTVAAKG